MWILVIVVLTMGKPDITMYNYTHKSNCRGDMHRKTIELEKQHRKYVMSCSQYLNFNFSYEKEK
jgi:hypothetical protein